MLCTNCGNKTKVINTRHDAVNNQTYRQMTCKHCGLIMYSIETEIGFDEARGFLREAERELREKTKINKSTNKCN